MTMTTAPKISVLLPVHDGRPCRPISTKRIEVTMSMLLPPAYGTSEHYLGEKGEEYFAWQRQGGLFAARINAHKFADHIRPEHTVLDFGCGGGFLLKTLTCARRIGVEINPVARRQAVELGVECYGQICEVPHGIADVIVSDHALEHVPFPIGALRELKGKLRPNGVLALVVPIDNWRRQRRYNPADRNHHLHTWTPQLMGNTLVEAGFEVLSVRARTFAWPGNWTVAAYGRLPFWLFSWVCYLYGSFTGMGGEVLVVAKPATKVLKPAGE
jgi:SAM-dependent methyltransferase